MAGIPVTVDELRQYDGKQVRLELQQDLLTEEQRGIAPSGELSLTETAGYPPKTIAVVKRRYSDGALGVFTVDVEIIVAVHLL